VARLEVCGWGMVSSPVARNGERGGGHGRLVNGICCCRRPQRGNLQKVRRRRTDKIASEQKATTAGGIGMGWLAEVRFKRFYANPKRSLTYSVMPDRFCP